MRHFSAFEYSYRDASNYKSFGRLLLTGITSDLDVQRLRNHLESSEFFIAEQMGIPALYGELWKLSRGPTEDDHVWHTFDELRPVGKEEIIENVFATVEYLISNFIAVKAWHPSLSPHWRC